MKDLLRALRDTVVDNPLVARDVTTRLRTRAGLAAASGGVLLLVGAATTVLYVALEHEGRLTTWRDPAAFGRPLVATVVILALLLTLLGASLSAAVGMATERERGTLDLLRTSALTPGQIVVGKALSSLLFFAPTLLVVPPLLALGAWLGDVSVVDVAGFTTAVWLHAVAAAAVGTFAGAWARRTRTATGPAVVGAGVLVGLPFTLPLAIFSIAWSERVTAVEVFPGVVSAILSALLVIPACLLGARSAVAPQALIRGRERRLVVAAVLVLAPALVAASLAALPAHAVGEAWANVLLSGWLLAALAAVVVEVACASSSLRAWTRVSGLALVGMGLAAGLATLALVAGGPDRTLLEVAPRAAASWVVLTLGLSCAAALTGVVSGNVRGRLVRVAVTGALLAGLAAAPLLLGFVWWSIGGSSNALPLISLNPLAQIASVAPSLDLLDLPFDARHFHAFGASHPTIIPGLAAYAALLLAGVFLMRARRTG